MIIQQTQIKEIVAALRARCKKIVTTNGIFDILHVGHIRYLTEAQQLGDILIVGVNSDSSTKALKGDTRPVNKERDRAEVLDALRAVDYVVIFEEKDPKNLLSMIQPDMHVKGGDYTLDQILEKDVVESGGGTIVLLKQSGGYSTTNTIKKITG